MSEKALTVKSESFVHPNDMNGLPYELCDKDEPVVKTGIRGKHLPQELSDRTNNEKLRDSSADKTKISLETSKDSNSQPFSKSDRIKECILQSVSVESKTRISSILNNVHQLSDVEKLLLYLQLPTGAPPNFDPLKQKSPGNPLGKKADLEVAQTYAWIQSHLEEDQEVSLPKQEVFLEYKAFCEANKIEALCSADFGKVMKHVFPSVKARRLGTRGNSRYCYSGLRKKMYADTPALPDVCPEVEMIDEGPEDSGAKDELNSASSCLIFEWAEKLLGKKFVELPELASHLVENMYVDTRSVAAFTILSSGGGQKSGGQPSVLLKTSGNSRRRETQLHLQRKLQEKELIREQKIKMQEQRSNASSKGKSQVCRKNSKKDSSNSLANSQSPVCVLLDSHSEKENPVVSQVNSSIPKVPIKQEQSEQEVIKTSVSVFQPLSPKKPVRCYSEGAITLKPSRPKKVAITRKTNSPAACFPQTTGPSFIILPSIPQMQMASDINKSPVKPASQKYKRIQPKPSISPVASSASAILSSAQCKVNTEICEKISFHIENQREAVIQEIPNKLSKIFNQILVNPGDNKAAENKTRALQTTESSNTSPKSETSATDNINKKLINARNIQHLLLGSSTLVETSQKTKQIVTRSKEMSLKSKSKTTELRTLQVKRPSEDIGNDFGHAFKKPHLETTSPNDQASNDSSLFSRSKGEQSMQIEACEPVQSKTSDVVIELKENGVANLREEVSIHQLESDALIEFLHGGGTESGQSNPKSRSVPINLNYIQESEKPEQNRPANCLAERNMKANQTQLLQLRLLLERNLPQQSPIRSSVNLVKPLPSSVSAENTVLESFSMSGLSELRQVLLGNNSRTESFRSRSEPSSFLLNWNNMDDIEHPLTLGDSLLKDDTSLLIENENRGGNCQEELPTFETSNQVFDIGGLTDEQTVISTGGGQSLRSDIDQFNQESLVAIASSSSVNFSETLNDSSRTTAFTQMSSVPPSPNTRRRAFNFMPISPRQTPLPELMEYQNISSLNGASPVIPQMYSMSANPGSISIAVGPSQPPSTASSPFVSPRGTPIPLVRSRHNSGQSAFSTPRQTPCLNFVDSGVSSISTSPFVSPQTTPIPVSRLRHNSNHGSQGKTVTFSTGVTQGNIHNTFQNRSRHNSGPLPPVPQCNSSLGSTGAISSLFMSHRSAPLSPLVGESCTQTSFTFPVSGDSISANLRCHHNSGSSNAPLSPLSSPVSPSNPAASATVSAHMIGPFDPLVGASSISNQTSKFSDDVKSSNLYPNGRKLPSVSSLLSNIQWPASARNNIFWQNNSASAKRNRHVSGSVIHHKPSTKDSLAREIQSLLPNHCPSSSLLAADLVNRSRSVPLQQMLLSDQCLSLSNLTNAIGTSFVLGNGDSEDVYTKFCSTNTLKDNAFNLESPMVASTDSGCDSFEEPLPTSPFVTSCGSVASQMLETFSAENSQKELCIGATHHASSNDWMPQENLSSRRNLTELLEQPIEDDLQKTLEDLRDCDNDFSKFAQELEQMDQNKQHDF